jgi:2-isopropylmalate synthase
MIFRGVNFEPNAAGATPPHVYIFDTTLRDGEQTPGVHFSPEQKVQIARELEALGVDTIEAGFPASSPGDHEAVRRVCDAVERCEVAALARCVEADIEAAVSALSSARRPVVHLVLGASDIHLQAKLGLTRAEALRRVEKCVRFARERAPLVQFSPEDATRAERAYLRQMVLTAVDAGATRINIPDTVGFATPWEYAERIAEIVAAVPEGVRVAAHCHDDLGLATANTLAAVHAGAREVQVTVNGIGERAGNTAFEEVAALLAMKNAGRTHVRLRDVRGVSKTVAEFTRMAVPPNKAIVGAHAFAHSSGIHQDGILKDPRTYGFLQPEAVGVEGHRLVLTARSGRSALAAVARSHGHDLSADQLDAAYCEFLIAADACEGAVDDATVRAVCEGVTQRKPATA